jgi:hypothetical protein
MYARCGLTIFLPQVVLTLMSESLFKAFKHKEALKPDKSLKISKQKVAT